MGAYKTAVNSITSATLQRIPLEALNSKKYVPWFAIATVVADV
jgi:hypothetical protein